MESHGLLSAEAAAQAQETGCRAVFDALGDAVLVHEAATGEIREVNRKMCDLFGYSPDEARRLNIRDLVSDGPYPPETAPDLGHPPSLQEWQVKDRSGRQFWVEARLNRTVLQGREQVCAVLRDISGRQRLEADRRECESIYRLLMEGSLAGVYIIQEGKFSYVNALLAQIFGYSAEEMINSRVTPEDLVHPDDLALVRENLSRRLAGEVDALHYTFRGRRRDGAEIHCEVLGGRMEYRGKPALMGILVDRTAKISAQKALQVQKNLLNTVFSATPDLLVLKNRESVYQAVNPAFCRYLGKPEGEIVGKTDFDLFPAAEAEIYRRDDLRVLETGGQLVQDEEVTGAAGRKWLQVAKTPVFDEQGRCTGVLCSVLDISERREVEEALKASEANYRTIFNTVNDGIAVVDLETGNFLDVNQRWCQMTGFSPEEARGLNVAALCLDEPPYTAADAMRWIIEASKEKPGLFEFLAKTKDGRRHWVEVNLKRTIIGGQERLLTVVRDISSRKRTEEALRASEAKYRNLVEQIPAVTYIAGLDDVSCPVYISPQIKAILGFTPEEWLAEPEMFKKQLHPEDRDRVLTELLLGYAAGGPFGAEYRMLSKTGRVVWLRDESRAVYDSEGQPLFMQGVALDITKRKRGEQALGEANNKLRVLVQASPLAIVGLDLQGKVISWNPAAERIFGWRASEVMGRPHPIVPEEKGQEFKHLWQRVLQGERFMGLELRRQKKDGSLMDVSLSTAPLHDGAGHLAGAMGVFEDITARKGTAAALRKVSRALKAVTECDQALLRATNEAELLSEVCRIIVEVGGYRMAWVGFAQSDEAKSVLPVGQQGFDKGYVQTLGITWADEERGRGPVGTAIRTGKPAIIRDTRTDPRFAPWRQEALKRGYASVLGLPLTDNQPFGALAIYATEPNAFDDEEINLLLGLANDLAFGIKTLRLSAERQRTEEALQDSEQKLRLLASQLLTIQEKERRRVSRELHDELGQALTVLKIHLVDIENKLRQDQQELKLSCEHLLGYIDAVIENVRRLSWDLSPSILEDLGLSSSLKYLVQEACRNHRLLCTMTMDEIGNLFSPEARINIYRIFQESLTNIVRHADATDIDVEIKKHEDRVSFHIKDNGKGFDLKRVRLRTLKRGLGLTTMHERALMAGGTLNIWSRKGKGTGITLTIPIQT